MENSMKNKLYRYGNLSLYLAMVSVIITAIVAVALIPLPAHAECAHGDWGKAKHAEYYNQHMASLHDALKLTDTQESDWKVFVEASKPKEPFARLDRSEMAKLTSPERVDRMLTAMKVREQSMASHAEAVKRFYSILTPDQQKAFDAAFHADKESRMKEAH